MSNFANDSNSHQALYHKSNLGGYTDKYRQNVKKGGRRRTRRRQRGGERYTADFSLPSPGRVGSASQEACGAKNPANLGAFGGQSGGAYSYATTGSEGGGAPYYSFTGVENANEIRGSYAPMSVKQRNQCGGGRNVCHKIGKINTYAQVSAFWSKMCPSVCKLYRTHVKGKEAKHNKYVVSFLRHCTRAMCQLFKGLKGISAKSRRACLSRCKKHLTNCNAQLRKMGAKRASMRSIKKICEKMLKQKKITRGRRKRGRRKTLRGGYSQFGSNVPNTPLYSTGAGVSQSALATPPRYSSVNNCTDNYNHYN